MYRLLIFNPLTFGINSILHLNKPNSICYIIKMHIYYLKAEFSCDVQVESMSLGFSRILVTFQIWF